MSGGHYDYLFFRIRELADKIDEELKDKNGCFGEHEIKVSEFKDHLYEVAECARELEWWMSGDSDEEDFLYKLRKLK